MRLVLRLALIAAIGLPMTACVSYHERTPRQPDNVVVTPPPASGGTTVITPNR